MPVLPVTKAKRLREIGIKLLKYASNLAILIVMAGMNLRLTHLLVHTLL